MDANETTFGIEIESTIPTGALPVGSYTNGATSDLLPAGWTVKYDSSIRAGRGRQGAEIVSPVLKGADGLRQIKAVCQTLNQLGARVNRSCGLHVHVGYEHDMTKIQRLTNLVANFEKAIYASTGTVNRERNHFARPISQLGNADALIQSQTS